MAAGRVGCGRRADRSVPGDRRVQPGRRGGSHPVRARRRRRRILRVVAVRGAVRRVRAPVPRRDRSSRDIRPRARHAHRRRRGRGRPARETLACASRVHPSTVTIYRLYAEPPLPRQVARRPRGGGFLRRGGGRHPRVRHPLPGDGDGDGDGIAIPEEVAEEFAALAAIFDEEMRTRVPRRRRPRVDDAVVHPPRRRRGDGPDRSVQLRPEAGADRTPGEHPAALPATSLRGVPRAVADRMRTELEPTAREAGESCGGEAALFSIVSEVREWAEGAARRAVVAGDFAAVGERRDDDEVDEVDDDDANEDADDDEVGTDRWWESEDTDPALVEAATTEALDAETRLRRARGARTTRRSSSAPAGVDGRSSSASSVNRRRASPPFSTPRESWPRRTGAPPGAPLTRSPRSTPTSVARSRPCDARAPPRGSAGRATPRTGRRMSTASTAVESRCWSKTWPGWSPGRTRVGPGVTPSSTTCATRTCSFTSSTRREGRTGRASTRGLAIRGAPGESHPGDVAGDVQWVREELHRWIFGNVRRKWRTVRRKPERLQDLFVGYHCVRATVDAALDRMPNVPDPRGGSPASERWPGRSASSTSSSRTSSACDSPSSSR